jgi:protein-L-isoaspartate(D-aspartate) O-methyltransferase
MGKVRRHLYIPEMFRRESDPYGDHPCSIGYGQTISQPFIVAYMTERMGFRKGDKVLEVGAGSGYQAAVLAELGLDVYAMEVVPELAEHARKTLTAEGYAGVHVRTGDGHEGWPECRPFNGIMVNCSPNEVPSVLVDQIQDGGRMILPLDTGVQRLVMVRKKDGLVRQEDDILVRFVPMVHGRHEQ